MYSIIKQIINFTASGNYLSSDEQYFLSICGAIIILLFVVTMDWWRLLFRTLINKLK